MTVVTCQIVKYCRNFFSQLKIYVTSPMSCTSKFSSHVTMISNFFFNIINKYFTNPTTVTLLKLMFFFFTHDQIFVKVFVRYFSAVLILLKNCFNKFVSCIFTSINNNWLSKPIINTNNFVSKTTRNVILIFLVCKNLHSFQQPLSYNQNQHKLVLVMVFV